MKRRSLHFAVPLIFIVALAIIGVTLKRHSDDTRRKRAQEYLLRALYALQPVGDDPHYDLSASFMDKAIVLQPEQASFYYLRGHIRMLAQEDGCNINENEKAKLDFTRTISA